MVSLLVDGYVDSLFGEVPSTYTAVIVEALFWGFSFLGLYGWIVSNANVAIGADFFNRDVLFWRKGGRIVAPALFFAAYVLANLPPWWAPQAYEGPVYDIVTGLFVIVVAYAIAVLSVTYLRIEDRRIKTYTLWVALSLASVLGLGVSPTEIGPIFEVALVYFMYRAVRSLAIRTTSLSAS